MFETAELGQRVSKTEFKKRELELWKDLLQVQREIRAYGRFPTIIDFAGVHGAGKGTTVNLLNKWMDPRWILTRAYGAPSEEERTRPRFWKFWRDMPPKGTIGLYLSGRYSKPLVDYVHRRIDEVEFKQSLERINSFERALADDGTLILKFWMHLGQADQKERLHFLENDPLEKWHVTEEDWKHWQMYDRFIAAAETLITRTNTGHSPWHIVEGQDYNFRSLAVGELVRDAMVSHLENAELDDRLRRERVSRQAANDELQEKDEAVDKDPRRRPRTIFDSLNMSKRINKKDYRDTVRRLSSELNNSHREALKKGVSTVLVFEGPDAAGKGGTIRRMTSALDAQNCDVIGIAAPTEDELKHNYLWRFWRHLPRVGYMTVFDRSWYGRVLVERVEGLATSSEWERAYAEIIEFEEQLIEHGVVLLKFWLHITNAEQERRFKARQEAPHKRWKLTDEDWRNRDNWDKYSLAAHEMIQKTNTGVTPWRIIEGNDKLYARVKVMEAVGEALNEAISE
jgi:polyphosphate:AMP phosphotransferase